jgi:excisionase family DNA binding protein
MLPGSETIRMTSRIAKKLTVSIAEAAEMLGVHGDTIVRMIKSKKLRATKIDRRVLIKLADIEQMLAENPA